MSMHVHKITAMNVEYIADTLNRIFTGKDFAFAIDDRVTDDPSKDVINHRLEWSCELDRAKGIQATIGEDGKATLTICILHEEPMEFHESEIVCLTINEGDGLVEISVNAPLPGKSKVRELLYSFW